MCSDIQTREIKWSRFDKQKNNWIVAFAAQFARASMYCYATDYKKVTFE